MFLTRMRGSILFAGLAIAAPAFADIYGTPNSGLIARADSDYCTGCLFAYAQAPAAAAGESLLSWSFYSTDNHPSFDVGRLITPLLFDSSFKVVGIGTTQTATLGLQSYSFGLVSGTDIVSAGDWFGWRDGSTTVGNNGIISLDYTGGPGVNYYTCSNSTYSSFGTPCYYPGNAPVTVGDSYSFSNVLTPERTYSVNFTVPEPDFYVVLGLALTVLVLAMARRRTRPLQVILPE